MANITLSKYKYSNERLKPLKSKLNKNTAYALKELKKVLSLDEKIDFLGSNSGMTLTIPGNREHSETVMYQFTMQERLRYEQANLALTNDPSFEYLTDSYSQIDLGEVMKDFIMECVIYKSQTVVEDFIANLAKEPEEHTVYIPIEDFEIQKSFMIGEIELHQYPSDKLKDIQTNYFKDIKVLAAAKVKGTNIVNIRARALDVIEFELRKLRVGMRNHPAIHAQQLLFQTGRGWYISNGYQGWNDRSTTIYSSGLNDEIEDIVKKSAAYNLKYKDSTRYGRKLKVALYWIEQGILNPDLVMKVMFNMFTLEALLSSRHEKLKAKQVAFNAALISTIVNGNYPDPYIIFKLYEDVRSNAVHGEEILDVNEKQVKSLSSITLNVFKDYMKIVETNNIKSHTQFLEYINNHESKTELKNWLIKLDSSWNEVI